MENSAETRLRGRISALTVVTIRVVPASAQTAAVAIPTNNAAHNRSLIT